jgi:amidase
MRRASTTPSEEIWRWSAAEIAGAIERGRISSAEAVASCLDRIAAVNPKINAIVNLLADQAIAAAEERDRARYQGNRLGLLHGVPVTVKINVDLKGQATTDGVPANRDAVAPEGSPVVANLRKAGAVILGQTNTPEFSFRWFTENPLHGRTLNPWDPALTPGGSSGGAAAAVAAGMCPIAHGNDIGGSVRYPAYACGVAGLRPTAGRIPSHDASDAQGRALSSQVMSVEGMLARRVDDVRLALAAMARGDPRDPIWVPAPPTGPAPGRPIRVALVDEIEGAEIALEVRDALHRAGRWLEEEGYAVERAAPPDLRPAFETWLAIAMNDVRIDRLATIGRLGSAAIRNAVHGMLAGTPVLDLQGYMQAIARRDMLRRRWAEFMVGHPVLLIPCSCKLPFAWGADQQGDAAMVRMLEDQSPLLMTAALGLPGLSVPTGLVGTAPVGVQLVAGAFREDLLLDAGEAIERRAAMPPAFDRPDR